MRAEVRPTNRKRGPIRAILFTERYCANRVRFHEEEGVRQAEPFKDEFIQRAAEWPVKAQQR